MVTSILFASELTSRLELFRLTKGARVNNY